MLESILVFLMFVVTGFVIVRTGPLSPAAIVCQFSTFSIVVFCYIVFGGGKQALAQGGGLSFPIGDYKEQASQVIGIYFTLVAVTAMATLGLLKKPDAETQGSGNYFLSLMDRFLFSSAMPLIAGGLLALTVLSLLLSLIGASNSPLVQVVSMGIGPATIVYISLLIYSWGKQSKLVVGMLLLLFLYNYLFILAYYSRFSSLTLVVATGLVASKRITAGKKVFSPSVFALAFLSCWMFLYALQGRGSRGAGNLFSIFNFPVMINHFFGVTLDSTTLATVATNIFAGPMILAECLGTGSTVAYDPRYMYLSFSPLPAFLDGWRSVINAQQFVNAHTPFSAFAEVYYFGGYYILLFAILLAVCIRTLTKIYLQVGGAGGLLLTSPCVYSLLCLHQYALRNSMRLLYLTTLLVYFLSVYLTKKAKEQSYAIKPRGLASGQGATSAARYVRSPVRPSPRASR